MKIKLLDTWTGLEAHATDPTLPYDWQDGDWSCDCNRAKYFDNDPGKDGVCSGALRYLVVGVSPENLREARKLVDGGWSLHDFNYEYPDELLSRHGIYEEMPEIMSYDNQSPEEQQTGIPDDAEVTCHEGPAGEHTGCSPVEELADFLRIPADDPDRVMRMALLSLRSKEAWIGEKTALIQHLENENREMRLTGSTDPDTPDFRETVVPSDEFFVLHEMYQPGFLGVKANPPHVAVYSIELMIAAVQTAESVGREMAMRHIATVMEGAAKELGPRCPVFVDDSEFVAARKDGGPKIVTPG